MIDLNLNWLQQRSLSPTSWSLIDTDPSFAEVKETIPFLYNRSSKCALFRTLDLPIFTLEKLTIYALIARLGIGYNLR